MTRTLKVRVRERTVRPAKVRAMYLYHSPPRRKAVRSKESSHVAIKDF
jgi:hypothetical protein